MIKSNILYIQCSIKCWTEHTYTAAITPMILIFMHFSLFYSFSLSHKYFISFLYLFSTRKTITPYSINFLFFLTSLSLSSFLFLMKGTSILFLSALNCMRSSKIIAQSAFWNPSLGQIKRNCLKQPCSFENNLQIRQYYTRGPKNINIFFSHITI